MYVQNSRTLSSIQEVMNLSNLKKLPTSMVWLPKLDSRRHSIRTCQNLNEHQCFRFSLHDMYQSNLSSLWIEKKVSGIPKIIVPVQQEATADELEEAYRSEVWNPSRGRVVSQKSLAIQAARVELQTLRNEAKAGH